MIFFLLTNYLWWKFRWNINFQKFHLNKEQGIIFFLLTLLETSKIYRKHHLFKRQKLIWIIKMRNANTRTNWFSICLKSYNYIKFNINRLTDCTHGVNLWIFCWQCINFGSCFEALSRNCCTRFKLFNENFKMLKFEAKNFETLFLSYKKLLPNVGC